MTNGKRPANDPARNQKFTNAAMTGFGILVVILIILFIKSLMSSKPAAGNPPAYFTGSQASPFQVTPHLVGTRQYSAAPPMMLDLSKQYFATVKMAKGGEFVIQLYPDKAPIAVNSFVFLAQQGYFDGVTFHRVLSGFMAQGGDPTGTGMGGPGYQFVNEASDLTFDKAGVVAMANAGRNTNGSQFFITFAPAEHLNGGFTIFGQVIQGMDVVNAITLRDPDQNPTFAGDAISTIVITEK